MTKSFFTRKTQMVIHSVDSLKPFFSMYNAFKQNIHNYGGWGKVELKIGKVVDWSLLELKKE